MAEELGNMSTAELVEIFTSKNLKFRSVSVGDLVGQLIRRALDALQELQSCGEDGDDDVSEEAQNELSILYHDRCYTQLVSMLSSAGLSARALAGVTYLLALLTAGNSDYAEDFRSKMLKGSGVLRLVALLSAESVSVRFNALLVLGNLLRHCPTVQREILRLGGVRKLAMLFEQACEEPQQNLCADAFLLLCDSDIPELCQELLKIGSAASLLKWIGSRTSERVAKKAVTSINIMLEKSAAVRSGVLQLSLVEPLLSVVKRRTSPELLKAALVVLEKVCCQEENNQHRLSFIERGGVSVLLKLLGATNDRELLGQVVRMLTSLANLDARTKHEVANNGSCLQFLQELLIANNGVQPQTRQTASSSKTAEVEHPHELFPLPNDLVAAIRLLFQACSNSKSPQSGKRMGNCAPVYQVEAGRVAAKVGAK
ncbi:hypothetical protein R1flu_014847 [Riccia fluitans]|uniref:Uncharacterized protein n=1 Tax=Riccia fluitans TaxID=41844 RepID=A0ABD1YH99_9MARC